MDISSVDFWLKIISFLLSIIITMAMFAAREVRAYMQSFQNQLMRLQAQVSNLLCRQGECDRRYERKEKAELEAHRLDERIDSVYKKLGKMEDK